MENFQMRIDRSSAMTAARSEGREDVVIRFMTFQIFCLIYLQKLGVGPESFQISVTMLIMLASLCWMAASGRVGVSGRRLVFYLAFVGSFLMSQVISDGNRSIPSMIELTILYSFMTVIAELPLEHYMKVLDRFIKLMILPACIIIFQYVFQTVTGLGNPLNMNRMLPSWMLIQGFIYQAPYHWGLAFERPNGFFFLETSFASAFTASAAIVEATYFKRPSLLLLMTAATLLSLGGTGVTMLIIAAPFLVARLSPRMAGLVVVASVVVLLAAYLANVPLPLLSRVSEFNKESSSGAGRLLVPAADLMRLLTDPSFLLTGTGAGSASARDGSLWPLVKLAQEYGLLTMISFIAFYLTGIVGNFNLPLKVALSITYNFTGGYLLSPVMVELLAVLCIIVVPAEPSRAWRTTPARGLTTRKFPATP